MKWISVEDEKPTSDYFGNRIIIVHGRPVHRSEDEWPNEIYVAQMSRGQPHWYDYSKNNDGRLQFTHWMPMPDKPEIDG